MELKNYKKHLISSTQTIRKAVLNLNKLKKKFCLVIDKNNKFIGTVTDGDIRRGLLKNFNLKNNITLVCKKRAYFIKKKTSQIKIKNIFESKQIPFFPLLDKSKKIIKVYHSSENDLPTIENQMLIMAGGRGKRLRPYTNKIPKPMLPVNGKPIIERIILTAKKQGIKNFVISINYLGNKIKSYLKDGRKLGVNIIYIKEDKPLGTAGSLYHFNETKKPFIVSNADIISNINYREMLKYHKKLNSYITVGAISNFEKNHYGSIIFKNNRVTKIEEKKEKKYFINAGIYILNSKAKNFFKSERFFHMTDFIQAEILKNKKIYLFPIHENWYDYGIKEKYLKHNEK